MEFFLTLPTRLCTLSRNQVCDAGPWLSRPFFSILQLTTTSTSPHRDDNQMKLGRIHAVAVSILFLTFTAIAQDDLGKQLAKVAGQNAVSYVSPLLSGLGADLNSGLYHSADLHEILGFDVGVKLSAVTPKDEDKVFDFVLPDQITYSGVTLQAGIDYDKVITGSPTALGEKSGREVKVKSTSSFVPLQGQTIFTTPQGFNLKGVPLIVPQAAVGLPLGFEVIGRFIPTTTVPPSSYGE